jgi:hypothetical protein
MGSRKYSRKRVAGPWLGKFGSVLIWATITLARPPVEVYDEPEATSVPFDRWGMRGD